MKLINLIRKKLFVDDTHASFIFGLVLGMEIGIITVYLFMNFGLIAFLLPIVSIIGFLSLR